MCEFIEPGRLKKLAENHYKEHKRLITKLRKTSSGNLDDFVHHWDQAIFENIDCLACGNCCRTLGPRITEKDIERLSNHLKMKERDFVNKYLRVDEDRDYVFKTMPCPFLLEDNFCTVYEKRPKACRDYPHTHQPRFHNHLKISLKNTFICPVVYHIFRKLTKY